MEQGRDVKRAADALATAVSDEVLSLIKYGINMEFQLANININKYDTNIYVLQM
jgi:hypothetical protein